jgi:hypothetical protein
VLRQAQGTDRGVGLGDVLELVDGAARGVEGFVGGGPGAEEEDVLQSDFEARVARGVFVESGGSAEGAADVEAALLSEVALRKGKKARC